MGVQIFLQNPDFFFFNFYCYSSTVVSHFSSSLHPTPTEPTSLPHLHPPPWFCPCVLHSSSCNPLFPLSPPHSPLATARLFPTSMSLVVFCLLFSSIDYVPVKGEIIWYLSFTTQLTSLSIVLDVLFPKLSPCFLIQLLIHFLLSPHNLISFPSARLGKILMYLMYIFLFI